MDSVIIAGKTYKAPLEVIELLLMLSKELHQLQYNLQLANGYNSNKVSELYSGELFQNKEYMSAC